MKAPSVLLVFLLSWLSPLYAQSVLPAHPGPTNNSNSAGTTMFFDVEAVTDIVLTGLTTASQAAPGASFTVRVHTRPGTALGGSATTGPGSSATGWTLRGTVSATQGSDVISLPINLPPLPIASGERLGVALEFVDVGPTYFGTGSVPVLTYGNANLALVTGDARTAAFTTTGAYFSSRSLVGSLIYRLADPVQPAAVGPSDNGGAVGSAMFFNLQSTQGAVVTGMTTASAAAPGQAYEIDVYTRAGTALGNVTGSGPATSSAGWTLRGTVTAIQGVGEVSQPFALPDLVIPPGQTLGVGLVFRDAAPRYLGTGSPPLQVFSGAGFSVTTGQAMAVPFSTTSTVFGSRALIGSVYWRPIGQALGANPGPSNNGSANGGGIFFDLRALNNVVVTGLSAATVQGANQTFQLNVYTRAGSTLSGSPTGPTSSMAGWTLHAQVTGVQRRSGEVSLPISIPALPISAGQTVGMALVFANTSVRYVGTGSGGPPEVRSDGNLQITSGEVSNTPFTTTGPYFFQRHPVGDIYYQSDTIFRNGFEASGL